MSEYHKEVYYGEYCKKCKYFNKNDDEEPCCDCLSDPARVDSHKPIRFKERTK